LLYYIGYYADSQNKQNRKIVLSATNKMRYVFKVLTENNIDFQVVSSSMTTDKKYYSDSFEQVSEKMSFKQFKTFGRKNILTKLIDRYFSKIQLFNYLMKTVKKDDVLLVYHSPFFCKLIPLIKKIKKCKIILEVEEVYADVNGNKNLREKELYICNNADAFLFPTKMLSDAVNPNNKPYLLIHGTYMVEDDRENIFNSHIGAAELCHYFLLNGTRDNMFARPMRNLADEYVEEVFQVGSGERFVYSVMLGQGNTFNYCLHLVE